MVEEVCYAIKGDSLQNQAQGDDANMIFSVGGIKVSGVAMEYILQKIIGDIAVCIDLMILEVDVLVKFSGT